MSEKIAICPGSFDPPTEGHINIIKRALAIFDKVIVAVGENTTKATTFTANERVEMLREIFAKCKNVHVEKFDGLLVDFVRKHGGHTVLRGIRNMTDYEYEYQMALANKTLFPELEFIFMITEGKFAHLSSSIIKEILQFGGAGTGMIHPIVEKRWKEKLKRG